MNERSRAAAAPAPAAGTPGAPRRPRNHNNNAGAGAGSSSGLGSHRTNNNNNNNASLQGQGQYNVDAEVGPVSSQAPPRRRPSNPSSILNQLTTTTMNGGVVQRDRRFDKSQLVPLPPEQPRKKRSNLTNRKVPPTIILPRGRGAEFDLENMVADVDVDPFMPPRPPTRHSKQSHPPRPSGPSHWLPLDESEDVQINSRGVLEQTLEHVQYSTKMGYKKDGPSSGLSGHANKKGGVSSGSGLHEMDYASLFGLGSTGTGSAGPAATIPRPPSRKSSKTEIDPELASPIDNPQFSIPPSSYRSGRRKNEPIPSHRSGRTQRRTRNYSSVFGENDLTVEDEDDAEESDETNSSSSNSSSSSTATSDSSSEDEEEKSGSSSEAEATSENENPEFDDEEAEELLPGVGRGMGVGTSSSRSLARERKAMIEAQIKKEQRAFKLLKNQPQPSTSSSTKNVKEKGKVMKSSLSKDFNSRASAKKKPAAAATPAALKAGKSDENLQTNGFIEELFKRKSDLGSRLKGMESLKNELAQSLPLRGEENGLSKPQKKKPLPMKDSFPVPSLSAHKLHASNPPSSSNSAATVKPVKKSLIGSPKPVVDHISKLVANINNLHDDVIKTLPNSSEGKKFLRRNKSVLTTSASNVLKSSTSTMVGRQYNSLGSTKSGLTFPSSISSSVAGSMSSSSPTSMNAVNELLREASVIGRRETTFIEKNKKEIDALKKRLSFGSKTASTATGSKSSSFSGGRGAEGVASELGSKYAQPKLNLPARAKASKEALKGYQARDSEMIEARRRAIQKRAEQRQNKYLLTDEELKAKIQHDRPSKILDATKGWTHRTQTLKTEKLSTYLFKAQSKLKAERHNNSRLLTPSKANATHNLFKPKPSVHSIPKRAIPAWKNI